MLGRCLRWGTTVFRCRDYGKYEYFWIYFCGVTAPSGTQPPHYPGFAITLI